MKKAIGKLGFVHPSKLKPGDRLKSKKLGTVSVQEISQWGVITVKTKHGIFYRVTRGMIIGDFSQKKCE